MQLPDVHESFNDIVFFCQIAGEACTQHQHLCICMTSEFDLTPFFKCTLHAKFEAHDIVLSGDAIFFQLSVDNMDAKNEVH